MHDRIGFESTIVCVNADEAENIAAIMQLRRLRGTRVGLWFWELEEFPDRFGAVFDPFHEIWVASEFNREAIQAKTHKPVRRILLPITLPTAPTSFTRRSLGLPDGQLRLPYQLRLPLGARAEEPDRHDSRVHARLRAG